jgi:hypothetical protein
MGMFAPEATVEQPVEGEIEELVRRDFVGLRTPLNDEKAVEENIISLLQRMSVNAVRDIDRLIHELQISRERLRLEGERVQREIVDYATLIQTSMGATQFIGQPLNQHNSILDAPGIAENV